MNFSHRSVDNERYLTVDPNSNPLVYYIKWVVSGKKIQVAPKMLLYCKYSFPVNPQVLLAGWSVLSYFIKKQEVGALLS